MWPRTVFIHPSIHPQMLNRNLWRTFQILWEVLSQVYHKPGTTLTPRHSQDEKLMLCLMPGCPVGFSSGFRCTPYVYMQREAENTKLLASVYIWKAHQGKHRKGGVTPPPLLLYCFRFWHQICICVLLCEFNSSSWQVISYLVKEYSETPTLLLG